MIHRRSNTNDNLEAETCRILIAWEDENFYFETGTRPKRRDTMEALSLSNLFTTLGDSNIELERMEEWLDDKAITIQSLTQDCKEMEEENR